MKSLLALLLPAASLFAAEPQFSDVFFSGKDGYISIRIPSVVVTKKGTALAFAQGRQKATDQALEDDSFWLEDALVA